MEKINNMINAGAFWTMDSMRHAEEETHTYYRYVIAVSLSSVQSTAVDYQQLSCSKQWSS